MLECCVIVHHAPDTASFVRSFFVSKLLVYLGGAEEILDLMLDGLLVLSLLLAQQGSLLVNLVPIGAKLLEGAVRIWVVDLVHQLTNSLVRLFRQNGDL